MTRKILLFIPLLFASLLTSCTRDQTQVQVVHTPLLTFTLNGTATWTAGNYSFAPVYQVVVYPQDTLLRPQVYNRYSLQATGKDEVGDIYQILITFDAADKNQLIGTYATQYNALGGLAQVQLFNLTNASALEAFSLCSGNLANAVFQVKNQSVTENLITGTFQLSLCNTRDTTTRVSITNGIFENVTY